MYNCMHGMAAATARLPTQDPTDHPFPRSSPRTVHALDLSNGMFGGSARAAGIAASATNRRPLLTCLRGRLRQHSTWPSAGPSAHAAAHATTASQHPGRWMVNGGRAVGPRL